MSNLYLAKYDDNWADEFDVSGHCVIDEKTYEKLTKKLITNPSFTMYIGTNEDIEYGEDGQSAEDAIDFQEITQDEYNVLKKLGLARQGFAEKFVERVLESEDGEDSWDKDEEEKDGFYIQHPEDYDDIYFDDFDAAIAYIEEEYGFDGEGWDKVKESKDFVELTNWLDEDPEGPFCYILKDGDVVA